MTRERERQELRPGRERATGVVTGERDKSCDRGERLEGQAQS